MTVCFCVGSRKIPIILLQVYFFYTVFFIPPLAYVFELSCDEKHRSKDWWPYTSSFDFGAKMSVSQEPEEMGIAPPTKKSTKQRKEKENFVWGMKR